MKKIIALALSMLLIFSLAACGNSESSQTQSGGNNTASGSESTAPSTDPEQSDEPATSDAGGTGDGDTNPGKYPENLDDWTAQNIIDYFTEAGVFEEKEGWEAWTQDHANYYPGTAIGETAGYWDDEGLNMIMMMIIDGSNADTSPEAAEELRNSVISSKMTPEDYGSMPVDHLAGNIIFIYSLCSDDDLYNAMDAAYNKLIADTNTTPDF